MGDGRGPAHRSPAPAALAKRVRRSVHGSVPPAALVCTGTVLLHFITGNLRAGLIIT